MKRALNEALTLYLQVSSANKYWQSVLEPDQAQQNVKLDLHPNSDGSF